MATATVAQVARVSKGRVWASRILSAIPVVFLLMDSVIKLLKPAFVVEATIKLGYPASIAPGLGILLLLCTLLYLIPRTSILGAILLTGYLGGAVDTHVRVSAAVFNIIFPVVFGALLWG